MIRCGCFLTDHRSHALHSVCRTGRGVVRALTHLHAVQDGDTDREDTATPQEQQVSLWAGLPDLWAAAIVQQLHRTNVAMCTSRHLLGFAHAKGLSHSLPAPAPHPSLLLCGCWLQEQRVASLRTRTVSTVAMIAGFLVIIYAGHVPLVLLVLTLQVSGEGSGQMLWTLPSGWGAAAMQCWQLPCTRGEPPSSSLLKGCL